MVSGWKVLPVWDGSRVRFTFLIFSLTRIPTSWLTKLWSWNGDPFPRASSTFPRSSASEYLACSLGNKYYFPAVEDFREEGKEFISLAAKQDVRPLLLLPSWLLLSCCGFLPRPSGFCKAVVLASWWGCLPACRLDRGDYHNSSFLLTLTGI
jgi:hypothetical protein